MWCHIIYINGNVIPKIGDKLVGPNISVMGNGDDNVISIRDMGIIDVDQSIGRIS